jgi:signal transduction histidine kinase
MLILCWIFSKSPYKIMEERRVPILKGFPMQNPPNHPPKSATQDKPGMPLTQYSHSMERLVTAVQDLSLARTLDAVMDIVRRAARELTGADGATFVLREGNLCYYAKEDAISPLWQGQKFPINSCISGWAMLNRESVVIEDVYSDARVPMEAYRPTFVKSLVMVPIRTAAPIGAIGNYWAKLHRSPPEEVKLLQALADSASVAMENVQLYAQLEQRVRDRTAQLESANRELEAFSYSVSHDLHAPLRSINGYSGLLGAEYGGRLDAAGQDYLERIRLASQRMGGLIDDMLKLSRITRQELHFQATSLSELAKRIGDDLRRSDPGRSVNFSVAEGLVAQADPGLLGIALQNLLGNAWKYTAKKAQAEISFSLKEDAGHETVYAVQDNGVGFDMADADKLFRPFQRLHPATEFSGTGVGLATAHRIIGRHGGRLWAEAAENQGATFYFTLPKEPVIQTD